MGIDIQKALSKTDAGNMATAIIADANLNHLAVGSSKERLIFIDVPEDAVDIIKDHRFITDGTDVTVKFLQNVYMPEDQTATITVTKGATVDGKITISQKGVDTEINVIGGVKQVETATAAGTASGSGNARVIVTAAGLTGSPVVVPVAIASSDDASAVAGKVRTALGLNAAIAAMFTISGATDKVILTKKVASANDATLNISIGNEGCTGLTGDSSSTDTQESVAAVAQVETATVVGSITQGVSQVETAVVVGTITVAGNATMTVTADGLVGSPKAIVVALAENDDASAVGAKFRAALEADADIAALFNVSGTGANVVLIREGYHANDATLNIAYTNTTCEGLTPDASSDNTVAGSASGAGDATVVVTAAGLTGSPKTFSVAVLDGETANTVAGKIRTALGEDADVSDLFTVSGATNKVILTAKTAAANDATLNIAIDNGTCAGLTTAASSANTTAGVAAAPQIETATIVGTITRAGLATVTVTSANMTGSPKTIPFEVALADDAAQVAVKMRAALNADADVSAVFTAGGITNSVTLTTKEVVANDATLNIAYDNGTSIGITEAPTSANTTAGAVTRSVNTIATEIAAALDALSGVAASATNAVVTVTYDGFQPPETAATIEDTDVTLTIEDTATLNTGAVEMSCTKRTFAGTAAPITKVYVGADTLTAASVTGSGTKVGEILWLKDAAQELQDMVLATKCTCAFHIINNVASAIKVVPSISWIEEI